MISWKNVSKLNYILPVSHNYKFHNSYVLYVFIFQMYPSLNSQNTNKNSNKYAIIIKWNVIYKIDFIMYVVFVYWEKSNKNESVNNYSV